MKGDLEGPKLGAAEMNTWRRSPYTKAVAQNFKKHHLEPAYQRLLRFAEGSTDPQVRAACSEFQMWERMVRFLETDTKEPEE